MSPFGNNKPKSIPRALTQSLCLKCLSGLKVGAPKKKKKTFWGFGQQKMPKTLSFEWSNGNLGDRALDVEQGVGVGGVGCSTSTQTVASGRQR